MKLYSAKIAPNPRRVHMFLVEKGLYDQVERIDLDLTTDAKSPDYLNRNPLGVVPALELDDGRMLTESRAICTYLEMLQPEPNLMGYTPEERVFFEMFDRRIEFAVLYPIANWVRHGHPGFAKLENPQVADWAESCKAKTLEAMAWLDADLTDRDFVAGNRFTVADITAHAAFEFGRLIKFKPWETFPNIARWREKMMERPSAQVV